MRSAAHVFVLALAAASCGGGRAGEGGAGWLGGNGNPVALALTFDPASGAAKVVTPRGGIISTTDADGNRYQLHIPEGALLTEERISLIPVASVKSLPLKSGSIAAVHLKPDGLRLLKPATLRIRPRAEVPVAEQVAFAYLGNGRDAHLYPLHRDRTRIEMPIFHFSGYGFTRAAPNDPGRIALQQAADKEARLASKVAEALSRERARPEGEPSNEMQVLLAALVEYYKQVVRPLMKIAETDERMAECAIQRALTWERQLQIFGLVDDGSVGAALLGGASRNQPDSPGSSELERLRAEAVVSGRKIGENARKKALERAVRRCKEEHDFSTVTELLKIERMAQLLGTVGPDDRAGADVDRAWEEITKCMTFEVELNSVIDTKTPSGGMYYHVRAQAQVSLPPFGGRIAGPSPTAPLDYVAFRASGNPKEDLFGKGHGNSVMGGVLEVFANADISAVGTRPGTLTVHAISWDWKDVKQERTDCDGKDFDDKRRVAENFRVTLSPAGPTELVRVTPKYQDLGGGLRNEPSVQESSGWLGEWERRRNEHQLPSSDESETSHKYQLHLNPESPGVWRVNFKGQGAPTHGFSTSETSYVVLRHTPR